ncbi:PspA/IM30 family protein [Alicyclobacillus sp. ALC3]|uniref:PspA/IM30 family protein n=1 Tax=Alicyclobacillus sp. ALC3 TaxID=2796143 RepID=UPI002377FA28|nr:PspA/IM30 family protein [Alicyclobacillus sp. ALC3]WDL98810.1 PspA/IM30 family protein [Alicyclobacillus sp. ALC3]
MSLLTRFKDLVRANLNDLISKAEDPEKSLNLFIEDATEHVREFTVEVNRYEAERIMLRDRIKASQKATDEWQERAELALKQEKEDLARRALEQSQKEKTHLEEMNAELVEMDQTSVQLKEQHQLLQEKLAEAKEKRDDLIRRNRLATAQKGAADSLNGASKTDPFAKFDRMEDIVQHKEAEAKAAYTTMTGTLSYEIDQLKKDQLESDVDGALAKLKEKIAAETKTS